MSAAALLVTGFTVWRLRYGVDLTDESFYIALPYRLVLGAKPFVDETSVTQQTAALLVSPFVLAYRALAGLTGIVVFFRFLQVAFSALVVLGMVVGLTPFLGSRALAAFVALPTLAYAPLNIHGLSYNTLGGGLFAAGCFLGLPEVAGSRRLTALLAGVAHGLAVFAYPPLAIPVLVFLVARAVATGGARRDALRCWVPALVLPGAALAALVARAGVDQVVSDYRRSVDYLGQGGGIGKLGGIAEHELTTFRSWQLLLPLLVALVTLGLRRRRLALPLLAALPLVLFPDPPVVPTRLTVASASLAFVAHYGLVGLPVFLLVRDRPPARSLLLVVWLPAFVAGVTTAYSSANGAVNFGVGFLPAAIATTALLVLAGLHLSGERGRLPAQLVAAAPAAVVLLLFCVFELPVYRDGPIARLTGVIRDGPYAGLHTTPAKRAFLDQLERDLAAVGPSCRILFFRDFPAGYLLTRARPDTDAAWIATVEPRQVAAYEQPLIAYYRRHGFPDVVVVVRRVPFFAPHTARPEQYRRDEPLLAALRSESYRLADSRYDYLLYRRPSPTWSLAPAGRQSANPPG
ncbi:MAG TPA: hypothetical protein VFA44_06860 [Gaiellaceae bacterium]|nr:hypothetical protein [Gaiellaceae bacterium]